MPGEGHDLSVQIFEELIGIRFVIAKVVNSSQRVEIGLIFRAEQKKILHELFIRTGQRCNGRSDR